LFKKLTTFLKCKNNLVLKQLRQLNQEDEDVVSYRKPSAPKTNLVERSLGRRRVIQQMSEKWVVMIWNEWNSSVWSPVVGFRQHETRGSNNSLESWESPLKLTSCCCDGFISGAEIGGVMYGNSWLADIWPAIAVAAWISGTEPGSNVAVGARRRELWEEDFLVLGGGTGLVLIPARLDKGLGVLSPLVLGSNNRESSHLCTQKHICLSKL
jgi:hypothetical protein